MQVLSIENIDRSFPFEIRIAVPSIDYILGQSPLTQDDIKVITGCRDQL